MQKRDILTTYWDKLVNKILVRGERGSFPCEGEILGAFNELKYGKPERKYSVSTVVDRQGIQFQRGDKINEIKLRKKFDSLYSIELVIDFQATVQLSINGSAQHERSFSCSSPTIDLQETLKNLDAFVENFPTYLEKFNTLEIKNAKKAKLDNMAKLSIRTAVEQIMSGTPYEWDLADKGEFHSLRIGMGKKNMVQITLNSRNFAKRISSLADALHTVEALFDTLPFPMDITMSKEFVKHR